jgi:hypothetical protein
MDLSGYWRRSKNQRDTHQHRANHERCPVSHSSPPKKIQTHGSSLMKISKIPLGLAWRDSLLFFEP